MDNKPAPRGNFYAPGLDMNRVYYWVDQLIVNCSFEEVCKIFREIAYDQVRYDSPEECSIIYRSDKYSELNREQANRFYRQVRTLCDLFAQCISDKREFEEGYLEAYSFAGPYLVIIKTLEERIEKLESDVEYYRKRDCNG